MYSTAIILGAIVGILAIHKINQISDITPDMKHKINMLFYRTIGVLFWPSVFYTLVPKQEQSRPELIVPFFWPILMWICDAYLITYGTPSQHSPYNVAMIRVEPSTVCSMSFALYGLVGGNLSQEHSHVFMYAILACIAFAFPAHNLQPGSPEEQTIEAFQRTITTFCTGLMFTGVALNRLQKKECEGTKK